MENSLLNSKKKSFGLYEAALATILFIVFNSVFIFFYRMVPVDAREEGSAVYYIASFLIEALFGVTAFVVATTRKVDFVKGIGANKKVNGNIVFYSVIMTLACLFLFGNLTDVFVNFLGLCGYSSILGSLEIKTFDIYLVYVLVSCVAPAVFEEVLFRGVIASGLKERGFKVALVCSAIIFSLMHGNPEQTIHQFVLGLVVGFVFLKTGNLWVGIIFHFTNNFTAVTMNFVANLLSKGDAAAEAVEEASKYGWGNLFGDLVIALIFAAVGYFAVKKLIALIIAEDNKLNGLNKENLESSTIKVDGKEVETQMLVEGEVQTDKTMQENAAEVTVQKTKEPIPISITIMFVLAGAYFAFEWFSSLLIGLGAVS